MGTAGFNCILYAESTTPPNQVIAKARDVELSANGEVIDISTRDSDGWKEHIPGLKEWELSMDELWVATDTALQALRSAFLNSTLLYVKIVDAGGYGFSGSGYLTSMKRGEPLTGAVSFPCTLKGTGALSVVTP